MKQRRTDTMSLAAGMLAAVLPAVAAQGQDVVLSPGHVVGFALSQNHALQAMRYDIGIALQDVEGAAARFKPSLSLHASYVHLNEAPTVSLPDFGIPGVSMPSRIEASPRDLWNIGYSLTQPLFTSLRTLNTYRGARLRYQSSQHALNRMKQQVRLDALRLFWTYVGTLQAIRPLEESVAWLEQLVRELDALVRAGVVVVDERLRMQTQLALGRLELARARDRLADIGEQLLLFCSLPLRTTIVIDSLVLGEIESDAMALEDDSAEQHIAMREDIRAMQLQLDAFAALRRVQTAAYLPTLMAAFTQQFKNQDPQAPGEFDNTWNLSASLRWQLLDWGAARSERGKTDSTLAKMRLMLEARKQAAEAEIASARRRWTQALEARRLALELVDNAQRTLRTVDARYREGLATGSDLMSCRKDMTQAQQELVAARIGAALAIEEYRAAVGR